MKLEINGKTYELYFGMAFLRFINEKYGMMQQGVNLGLALQRLLPGVINNDLVAMEDLIFASIKSNGKSITQAKLDAYFESLTADEVKQLREDLVTALNEANTTHAPLAQILEAVQDEN
ncbi:tail assembly chaperone [Limosilactobacillus gorillae]|uniref:tail assembly chaperone n=1 Tax=Limosilactobacillus gorillae TaxID=1450649 RepID=UPI000B2FBA45|nr:tail assembly chaperone [Limosilactobacillus gorillae]